MQDRDRFDLGDPYDRYMGRWSRRIAPSFVEWLGAAPGLRWLDVGCGTGALTQAVLEAAAPSSMTGIDPSAGFLSTARARVLDRAEFVVGSATALPVADDRVDVAVAGLVLNFVPDAHAAVAEMARVTVPGGRIGAYVWDYTDGMTLNRPVWDAAVELDPAAVELAEFTRFASWGTDRLVDLVAGVLPGAGEPRTTALDLVAEFADLDDYWTPFLGGQGPAPAYVASLDEASREALRALVGERLQVDEGPIRIPMRAWAVSVDVP